MKFPFVSRGRYEDMAMSALHANERVADYAINYHRMVEMYDELVKRVVAPPPQEPVAPPPPEPVPPPAVEDPMPPDVRAAISERAPVGSLAFAQVTTVAQEMLDNGVDKEAVIERILRGEEAPV
jgi:hypothetical protein